MNRPLTPTEECSLIHPQRTFDYYKCLNPKLENPSTIGFEVPRKQTIGMIFGIIAMVILILLALHYFRIITLPLPVPQKK